MIGNEEWSQGKACHHGEAAHSIQVVSLEIMIKSKIMTCVDQSGG
jgi:hypothetical protein